MNLFKRTRVLSALIFVATAATTQVSFAQQCLPPSGWAGCSNTDFSNAFMASTDNAATIEYDNWVSGFHASVIRNGDGSFNVWGEHIGNGGVDNHILTPTSIYTAYPTLTGTVLKVALGGYTQMVILSTDGLFAVGKAGGSSPTRAVILAAEVGVPTTGAFTKLTNANITNGNSQTGLPPGVTPGDVKMLFGAAYTLAITTCSGDVWILATNPGSPNFIPLAGDGNGNKQRNQWYRVKKDANNFLTNIVAARGNGSSMIALDANGELWTWGFRTFLGNNTAATNRDYATKMTTPITNGASVKMIGSTNHSRENGVPTFYVLASDGNLYALGGNAHRQLGNWGDNASATSTTWVQPRYEAANPASVMNNIKWISPQEHYTDHFDDYGEGSASINVITNAGILYNWGYNRRGMLGRYETEVLVTNPPIRGTNWDPAIPLNDGTRANHYAITATDTWQGVETGGHTSMAIRTCESQLIYAGHYISGSMGNAGVAPPGQVDDQNQYFFTKQNTPVVGICAAEAVSLISATDDICNGSDFTVTAFPAGGTFSILSGNASFSATLSEANISPLANSNNPVNVQYEAPPGCGVTKSIVLYKKDYGNLSNVWPTASASILQENTVNAWLGQDAGKATADCISELTDGADGLSITNAITGNGTESNKWQLKGNETYNVDVTVNGSGAAKNVYWAAWYDVTGNGSFNDADDVFVTGSTLHGSPATTSFPITVPVTATTNGATQGVIRVVASAQNYNFSKAMNGTIQVVNGEVEDYYVQYLFALPVKLTAFNVVKQTNNGLLTWETANETNTAHFVVEHSNSGNNYTTLTTITAAGNSSTARHYNFVHQQPVSGRNYYRLKMVDKDGKYSYSPVRTIDYSNTAAQPIVVYPSPATSHITVSGVKTGVNIKVISVDGRVLLTEKASGNNHDVNINKLTPGVYIIQTIDNNTITGTIRFTKK